MADDVTYQSATPATPPSGTVIATDEAGSPARQYQLVKLVDGTVNSETPIVAAADTPASTDIGLVTREAARGQAAMAASIPVVLANDQSSVAVTPSTSTVAAAALAAVTASIVISTDGAATVTFWYNAEGTPFTGQAIIQALWGDDDFWAQDIGFWNLNVSQATQEWSIAALDFSASEDFGAVVVPVSGARKIRLYLSGYTSGTLTVSAAALAGPWTGGIVGSTVPADAVGNTGFGPAISGISSKGLTVGNYLYNGATWDRGRSVLHGQNSAGTGIAAAGILAEYDDASPAAVTENQFAPVRISSRRALLIEGVASGTAVSISGAVTVSDALPAGDNNIGNVDVLTLPAIPAGNNNIGDVDIASIAAGTNYVGKVRLTDGTLDSSLVDETGSSAVDALAVGGGTPHDSVDSGNPIKLGVKAASAFPTAVAANDRANVIGDLWGRPMVTHIDPAQQVHKAFNATSTQTGVAIWDPTAGKKIAVTSVVIGTYGTTAGRVILWFGDNGDTSYTAGTDQLLLAFSTAPSASSKPGLVFCPAVPVFCTTADRELHITTDANVSIDVAVEGYEF